MKLQAVLFKVEELKALVSYYESTQESLAQGTTLLEQMKLDANAADSLAEVESKVAQLRLRGATIAQMLKERTGARDDERAFEIVQEHIARLQRYQTLRGEQLQLRTQLELELAIGEVSQETRRKAEDTLDGLQKRMDTLLQQCEGANLAPRILTLG